MKIRTPQTKIIEVDIPGNVILANAITIIRKAWDLPKGVYLHEHGMHLMEEVEYHTSHSYFAKEKYRPVMLKDESRLETLKEHEVLCQN